jgi:hypothetical protein
VGLRGQTSLNGVAREVIAMIPSRLDDRVTAVSKLCMLIEKALFHDMLVSDVYPCPFKSLILMVFRDVDPGRKSTPTEVALLNCVHTASGLANVKVRAQGGAARFRVVAMTTVVVVHCACERRPRWVLCERGSDWR